MPDRDSTFDPTPIPRLLEFALFLTALAWVGAASSIAARAAQGLATRFNLPAFDALLEAVFLLFLTVVGFRLLDLIATRGRQSADILPLPRRATRTAEWASGAAIGWALALAGVLPLLVSVHVHTRFTWPAGTGFGMLVALGTLLVAALAEEVIFRGYPFQRLAAALGQGTAALVLSIAFAITIVSFAPPEHIALAVLDGTCLGLVLALCYMRTHALWLGWGLHFAYRAAMAVLLGLPIAGRASFQSAAQTYTAGPTWLSGGSFGLDGALLTAVFLLGSIPVIYQVTRDWAWSYTHREITGAGYAVDVAPPAAHTAMEKSAAAAPPPLVQILPTTPQTFSKQDPS